MLLRKEIDQHVTSTTISLPIREELMCFEYISPEDLESMRIHFEMEEAKYLAEFKLHLFPKYAAPVILPGRKLEVLQWGFQHPTLKKVVFNARAETAAQNPLFRGAVKKSHACCRRRASSSTMPSAANISSR